MHTSACTFHFGRCYLYRRQCAFFQSGKMFPMQKSVYIFQYEKMFPMQTSVCIFQSGIFFPMQTSASTFQSGRCYLYRCQRAFFSPENVPYADLSVHFSVRKIYGSGAWGVKSYPSWHRSPASIMIITVHDQVVLTTHIRCLWSSFYYVTTTQYWLVQAYVLRASIERSLHSMLAIPVWVDIFKGYQPFRNGSGSCRGR